MLRELPAGTTRKEIEAVVAQRNWPSGGVVGRSPPGSIDANIGIYRGVFGRVTVFASWSFDENERMNRLEVYKRDIDAP